MRTTEEILTAAKKAAEALVGVTTEQKNAALCAMADALISRQDEILSANNLDVDAAKGVISEVMIDRLRLTPDRISDMAVGIRNVAKLPDPVGRIISEHTLKNGLKVQKVSVPFGVVAIIYESRPNVTSDAAALALKSGNACILRTGKEAYRSAAVIVKAMREGLVKAGICENAVLLIEDTSHAGAEKLMKADGFVDLLIPRGGKRLIEACRENATVPCILTGTGICHVYVDADADLEKALRIIENAKMSRPSVCNAEEVCIVNSKIAGEFLPRLKALLCSPERSHICELRCDERANGIIGEVLADENDFDTEFLDYILAIKVVDSAEEAIKHISLHSTHHSDAIISENPDAIRKFTAGVDSAAVYVNASTRFTDGGVFGLGCEMGISTQKLHARGPMGLEELNTYKYVITGNGQIR